VRKTKALPDEPDPRDIVDRESFTAALGELRVRAMAGGTRSGDLAERAGIPISTWSGYFNRHLPHRHYLDSTLRVLGVTDDERLADWTAAWLRATAREQQPPPTATQRTTTGTATPLQTRMVDLLRLQWRNESEVLGLCDTDPLPVRWGGDQVAGELDELIALCLRPPAAPVEVRGPAGCGKSTAVLLVVLRLLADWTPGNPVPVLLPLSTWDVGGNEHPRAWMIRRLAQDHPELAAHHEELAVLIAGGGILPLLDGLDELPEDLWERGTTTLRTALADGPPAVLTCRDDGPGRVGRSVVRLLGVEPAAAEAYVGSNAPWRAVLQDHGLRNLLTSPLLLWLARTAFPPGTDPARLGRFREPEQARRFLLDQVIPAAFAPRPVPPPLRAPVYRDAARAEVWLRTIARHLVRTRQHDLAWWELHRMIPGYCLTVGLGAVLGIVLAALAAVYEGAAATEAIAGLACGTLYGAGFARAYAVVRSRQRRHVVVTGFRPHPSTRVLARRLMLIGGVIGVAALMCWLLTGLPDGRPPMGQMAMTAAAASAIGPLGGACAGLVLERSPQLDHAVAPARAPSPVTALHRDRTAAFAFLGTAFLSVGVAAALIAMPAGRAVPDAAVSVLVSGVPAGLSAVTMFTAWPVFAVARGWLALFRRLPWRLMTFLEQAHRSGVLRQLGATYRFRHELLQQRLLERHDPHC
jgi:hypothetical protein